MDLKYNIQKSINNGFIIKNRKRIIIAPGDDIFKIMEHLKMSRTELGALLCKTLYQVKDLVVGNDQITPDVALKLKEIFGVDAQYWLRREMNYRKKLAFIEKKEILQQAIKDEKLTKELMRQFEEGEIGTKNQERYIVLL